MKSKQLCRTRYKVLGTCMQVGLFACLMFKSADVQAQVINDKDTLTVLMSQMADVEVVAKRVEQATLSHDVCSHEELNRTNTGQNLPYLLSSTPGIQITSDDGLGVGYTYFRLRGTDHTRINMTINDVPLNDSESQTVFWVNMTDMAASLQSVDVQRGVGTSTNGSASFGGSLNMQMAGGESRIKDDKSSVELAFNGGMYNTFREMVRAHIVLPGNRWIANARFSKVNSDGFLYRAGSDLYSYHGDIGWYGDKTQVVARLFGGNEKTGMGWDGVDYATAYGLEGADRRYNPAGEYTITGSDGQDSTVYYPNQTDNYAQQHAHLSVYHYFDPQWSMSATAHYTHGAGYYEQYKRKSYSYWGLPDSGKAYGLYQKHLNNHFFGLVSSAKYISEHIDVQFGLAANHYMGAHWGILDYLSTPASVSLPVHYEYYRNNAHKTDANLYAKLLWRIVHRQHEQLSVYADMQYRFVRYKRDGLNDENMEDLPLCVNYHFANPKAGLTYTNSGHQLSASFAIANREPSRNNYKENARYDATTQTWTDMPLPERLYDYELGYAYQHSRFGIGANLYMMDYDNQLVLTGEYNDVGAMKTVNVKDSYRMGAELIASVNITDWFRWEGNVVVSRNKIQNYKQYIDLYDNQNDWNWVGADSIEGEVTIAFSPTVTAMSLFTFDYAGFMANIQTNVVSSQYLDNTMDRNAMLKAYTTTNVHLEYTLPLPKKKGVPSIKLNAQLNNIFNAKYANNGGSDNSRFSDGSRCVWYFAQAGINVHGGFVVQW